METSLLEQQSQPELDKSEDLIELVNSYSILSN